MAKEGIPFILIFLIPAAIFLYLNWWVAAVLCLLLAAFMAFFFRDPERQCLTDDQVVLSPADGRVVMLTPVDPGSSDSPVNLAIFLSPMDVHINRSPIAGEIVDVVYKPGAFHIASKDIATVENEQNVITIKGRYVTIVTRQIAGALARRVVFWKKKGDYVTMGEKFGLMKFSSRMDVVMPSEVEVMVKKGDRVVGGITVIGRIHQP
jgi:phosphatidylserine decarboxylase